MKTKIVLSVIAGIVVITSLVFVIGYTDVFYAHTIGKAKQNAQQEVYKESQPYIDGMAQELSKLKLEYDRATDEKDKNAISFTIKHDFADFDENKLQSDGLRVWLIQMRGF